METHKKKYIYTNIDLMTEWHWEKNKELGFDPHIITIGSAKKVWWKCINGHEWEADINHRSRGRKCPICARRQRSTSRSKNVVGRRGSLLDNNPLLAKEWHPTKNGDLKPADVTVGNGRSVWWKCSKGHEWFAQIKSRNKGAGCPVCSGHKIVVGINDLATVNPLLAREWHPTKNGDLKPTDVTIGNGKNVWWKCRKGHEWKAKIANRAYGNNCPICLGKKVLVGYNDLMTSMPTLAKEWHPTKNGDLDPTDVTVGSNKRVYWLCKKGHEWRTSVSHRSHGRRCPICFGESKTSFPEQVIFFYLRNITTVYNRYKVDYRTEIDVYLPKFKIGIEYDGYYFHKSEMAKQREKRKQEKLRELGITLIRVKEIAGNSNERIVYTKPRANETELFQMMKDILCCINNITKQSFEIDVNIERDRNKIYENYIEGEKENSLVVVNSRLAKEWHPIKNGLLLPEYVSAGSNKKVWWKCKKGHEWQAVINSRNKGVGCPFCKNLIGKENVMDKEIDILIFGGQSNMQGVTECIPKINPPIDGAFEYRYLTDELIPVQHPFGETIGGDLLFQADGGKGSLGPYCCRAYVENTGREVVAIQVARGGTMISEWLKGTMRYDATINKIRAGIEKAKERGEIGKIYYLWLQGESDAIAQTAEDVYMQCLTAFKNDMKKEFGIDKFGIIKVGYYCLPVSGITWDDEEAKKWDETPMRAQERLVASDEDFVMLTRVCMQLSLDKNYINPHAEGHYNNAAMQLIGRASGEALAKL